MHLPSKPYVVGSNPTRAALFSFSVKKELFRLVVLPCLFLRRSRSFHGQQRVRKLCSGVDPGGHGGS